MSVANQLVTRVFDLLLAPFDHLPPVAGLAILALLTAVVVLLVFKWTSDQVRLAAAKRAMQAAIFEMRLFNDDLVLLFRAQADVLRHTLSYLRQSLAPTLWLVLPMLLLLLHMEFTFGYSGLNVGDTVLLKATVSDTGRSMTLDAPPGIEVQTGAVSLPSAHEIVWRIRPRTTGSYELRVRAGSEVLTKTLVVSDAVARRSPVRPGPGLTGQIVNPSEAPLPGSAGVAAISVPYPERPFTVGGWDIGWSGVYLLLTLAFAFALKGLFGVTL